MTPRGTNRDALRRKMILVSLAMVMAEDGVNRIFSNEVVDETDGIPVVEEPPDRELAEEVVPFSLARAKQVARRCPDLLDVLPSMRPVRSRGEGHGVNVVALPLLLE